MALIKAAAFTEVGKLEYKEFERPEPGKGEVLVRIKACAICTWEQRIFRGIAKSPFPFIGGHEASGIIEKLGQEVNEKKWMVGQKVALRLLTNCGECYYCRKGESNLCEMIGKKSQTGLPIAGPGGLSEYIVVSSNQLYKLTEEISFAKASLSEPLACVVHSIERAHIEIGDDVVVIGAGIMGMFHMILAKKKAARVIMCEVDEERRNLSKKLGADIVLNPSDGDLAAKIKEITEGRGADVVFNTTAISEVAETATKLAGNMGRVIFYSSIHPDKPISLSPGYIHNSEITVTGTVSPSISDFQKSTKLLSTGIIDPEELISAIVPFENVQEAFEKSVVPGTYRVVVTMK